MATRKTTAAKKTPRAKKPTTEDLLNSTATRRASTGAIPEAQSIEWQRVTVGFPKNMMPELKAHAVEHGISLSALCVQVMRRWMRDDGKLW